MYMVYAICLWLLIILSVAYALLRLEYSCLCSLLDHTCGIPSCVGGVPIHACIVTQGLNFEGFKYCVCDLTSAPWQPVFFCVGWL